MFERKIGAQATHSMQISSFDLYSHTCRRLPLDEPQAGVVVEVLGLASEIEGRLRTEANWLFNLISQVCLGS